MSVAMAMLAMAIVLVLQLLCMRLSQESSSSSTPSSVLSFENMRIMMMVTLMSMKEENTGAVKY